MTDESEVDFCSTRQAAELLGVSIKTAQAWVESGVLEAWKTPGGHRRIRRASVTSLLSQRQRPLAVSPVLSDSRLKILTVDDDPDQQRLYRLQIASWDLPLQHLSAQDGFEALLLIGEHSPDLLITDLHMPGFDGFRMLEALRKRPTRERLQIIIVSGLSAAEIRDRGGVPEGIEVLSKPVSFDRLQLKVRNLIDSR